MSITSQAEAKGSSQTGWKWGLVARLSMWVAHNRVRLQTCVPLRYSSARCQNRKLWTSNLRGESTCLHTRRARTADSKFSHFFCFMLFPVVRTSRSFFGVRHTYAWSEGLFSFSARQTVLSNLILSCAYWPLQIAASITDCSFTVLRLVSKLKWLHEVSVKCKR